MLVPVVAADPPDSDAHALLARAARYSPAALFTQRAWAAAGERARERPNHARAERLVLVGASPSASLARTAAALLDSGVDRVVVDARAAGAAIQGFDSLAELPRRRLVLAVSEDAAPTLHDVDRLRGTFSAFLVSLPSLAIPDDRLARLLAPYEAAGAPVHVLVTSAPQQKHVKSIAALDRRGINAFVPIQHLSDRRTPDTIDLVDAFCASLRSDRQDGLYATIVCDEYGKALGLCYSSDDSLRAAFERGEGVYHSRSRGLWHKGFTSGNTQRLLRVDTDCDRDTLRFFVCQKGAGFCHLNTTSCFGHDFGLSGLEQRLMQRKTQVVANSYTQRLFDDAELLNAKIAEEAGELCAATSKEEIAWEAADVIYFTLVKCVRDGVRLVDIEKHLNFRSKKITRRPGNAKPSNTASEEQQEKMKHPQETPETQPSQAIALKMVAFSAQDSAETLTAKHLKRPIMDTQSVLARVAPIILDVRARGDAAVKHYTSLFDKVTLDKGVVLCAPFGNASSRVTDKVCRAIDAAYANIHAFHAAQLPTQTATLTVETMPGVTCSRVYRPVERAGLYIPGGSAVLPSTALMLGIPARVAGVREIVFATPPTRDGGVCPEVAYVAEKLGVQKILLAGGAQAVAALAYGTESVPKVDKICGPGNQYVTAAKMFVQNDTDALVSIDMPAGPSELLVIADDACVPAYVASDLLSQAEHGPDSHVVLLAAGVSAEKLAAIADELETQGSQLPRSDIIRKSIPKSTLVHAIPTIETAIAISNAYAPEHLIMHVANASSYLDSVTHAGSVFLGSLSPESCGDYASGTNHTLPTYGYARVYSGVSSATFARHMTTQELTREGLAAIAHTVMDLARCEGLDAHANAVAIRMKEEGLV